MNLKEEMKNLSSVQIDHAAEPALGHIRAFFQCDTPTEDDGKRVDLGMRMIGLGTRRYGAENTRASLAMKAAAFAGKDASAIKTALRPVINLDASAEVAQVADQQLAGQIEAPKPTARKRNGK